jgi:Phytanoyl-CoA dioxygenase (PhyH)
MKIMLDTLLMQHDEQGWCVLEGVVLTPQLQRLRDLCDCILESPDEGVRQSAGAVYAARNVMDLVPDVCDAWKNDVLLEFVRRRLGVQAGLVRVLYFDKPPEQSWALPWHKDLLIAVDSMREAPGYSPPRPRAGVPHTEPPLEVLESMLTLRIHLDEITPENGPLQVASGSQRTGKALQVDGYERHSICTAAGSVLAMTPLLAHCSGRSSPGTTRHRRILHLEFSGLRELPGGVGWHQFVGVNTPS